MIGWLCSLRGVESATIGISKGTGPHPANSTSERALLHLKIRALRAGFSFVEHNRKAHKQICVLGRSKSLQSSPRHEMAPKNHTLISLYLIIYNTKYMYTYMCIHTCVYIYIIYHIAYTYMIYPFQNKSFTYSQKLLEETE